VDRTIAHLGLTHAHYSALATLHGMSEDGQIPTQRELADATRLQVIYISKLVRSLETDGFVTRTPDLVDSRALRLTLTEVGRNTIVEARGLVGELDKRLTTAVGGPGSKRVAELSAVLQLLIDDFDQHGGRS
jgi:DNA-binding MarR family transcriptional regulator